MKYGTRSANNSRDWENKASLSGWTRWAVAEAVGMCGALMFLMKSTELHWSTRDESELSKAIRQVKDPLSAPRSTGECDAAAAQGAAAPPQAKCGGDAHMQIHFWCHRGVKKEKKRGVRYDGRTFCDALRCVGCNTCWSRETKLWSKPWVMDWHVCVHFSVLSVLPLWPLPHVNLVFLFLGASLSKDSFLPLC